MATESSTTKLREIYLKCHKSVYFGERMNNNTHKEEQFVEFGEENFSLFFSPDGVEMCKTIVV